MLESGLHYMLQKSKLPLLLAKDRTRIWLMKKEVLEHMNKIQQLST